VRSCITIRKSCLCFQFQFLTYLYRSDGLSKSSQGCSVTPSDSVSQRGEGAPYLIDRPAERPSDFSSDVLWTIRDCHRDALAYKSNRIILNAAIRNKDGSSIDYIEGIKTTARVYFLSSLMHLPVPLGAPERQTGLWWKSYRPDEWRAALNHLEVSHPVISYCSLHWKAEEIYRVVIQTRLDSDRAKRKETSGSVVSDSVAGGSLKRAHSAIGSASSDSSPSLEEPPDEPQQSIPLKPTKRKKKGM